MLGVAYIYMYIYRFVSAPGGPFDVKVQVIFNLGGT